MRTVVRAARFSGAVSNARRRNGIFWALCQASSKASFEWRDEHAAKEVCAVQKGGLFAVDVCRGVVVVREGPLKAQVRIFVRLNKELSGERQCEKSLVLHKGSTKSAKLAMRPSRYQGWGGATGVSGAIGSAWRRCPGRLARAVPNR